MIQAYKTSLTQTLAHYSSSILHSLPTSLPVSPCSSYLPNSGQISIPIAVYLALFPIFGSSLYFFLLVPMSLRRKQVIAAPLVFGLLILPLLYASPGMPGLKSLHLTSCGCVLLRVIDLYYVTPWRTGIEPTMRFDDWWVEIWKPFRNVPLTLQQIERQRSTRHEHEHEHEQSHGQPQHIITAHSNKDNTDKRNDAESIHETTDTTPLFQQARKQQVKTPDTLSNMGLNDPNPQHWSMYLPRWILFAVVIDITTFTLSFLPLEMVLSLSWFPRALVHIAVSLVIIYYISLVSYTLMIIWANVTGGLIHNTSWTLVRHTFPGFATSPAEFWRQWHHIFQYIWVDIGLKPTQFLLQKYNTASGHRRISRAIPQALEKSLPILAVFLMSGLMHEYSLYGMWHEQFGYMLSFFMIQGISTVASKALQDTVGQHLKVPSALLMAATWAFNLTTVELFMRPVIRNAGYNLGANHSLLLHAYNSLRANRVF